MSSIESCISAKMLPIAPVGIQRFAEILPNARIPALVLWGSDDQVFPVEGAAKLAARRRTELGICLKGSGGLLNCSTVVKEDAGVHHPVMPPQTSAVPAR